MITVGSIKEYARITVTTPKIAGRNYTTVTLGTCTYGGSAATNRALQEFQVNFGASAASSCNDVFKFGWLVSLLDSECGLTMDHYKYVFFSPYKHSQDYIVHFKCAPKCSFLKTSVLTYVRHFCVLLLLSFRDFFQV